MKTINYNTMQKQPLLYEKPDTTEVLFARQQPICTSPEGSETETWTNDDDFILIKD